MWRLRNHIEGLKSADIMIGLYAAAQQWDVQLKIERVITKGWLIKTETIFFKATADSKQRLEDFQTDLIEATRNFNSQIEYTRQYS